MNPISIKGVGADYELHKAELLQEGIFFLMHLFGRDVLLRKKLEIEKTKPTFIKVEC